MIALPRALWLVAAMLAMWPAPSVAAGGRPALSELAVDQVTLRGGRRLYGAVLHRASDGTTKVAVSREWLGRAHPDDSARYEAEALAEARAALAELRDRLGAWSAEDAETKALDFFLRKETERVETALGALEAGKLPDTVEFLILSLPAARIERAYLQPAARRQIAALAWRERLSDVETRSAAELARELRERGLDPAREHVDLGDRLPAVRQNDDEWAARRAIVEYQHGRALDFQGSGDLVFRTSGDKAPDLAKLLPQLLGSTLTAQIADLLEEPSARPRERGPAAGKEEKWLAAAIREARREGAGGFRVTRVETDPAARRVSVETRFVARLAEDRWQTVWRHVETADASVQRNDLEERIAADPQVKGALDLLRAAGLDAGGGELQTAIRFGAATMAAQQEADSRFFEFRDRYLRRLDGPPLIVAPER